MELQDLDSHRVNAKSLRGKVVLVVFWDLACRPCREELPRLNALYASHQAQGLQIIGISDDAQQADRFREFVAAQELTWPQVLVDRLDDPRISDFHETYNPSMFLADRASKVQPPIGQLDCQARVDSMFAGKHKRTSSTTHLRDEEHPL